MEEVLRLRIQGKDDIWDERKEEFFSIPGCDVVLKHTLKSVSRWEAKYKKPYLTSEKSVEENLDYIRMMVIEGEIKDPNTLLLISKEQLQEIHDYINDPMTATVFSKEEEDEATKKTTKRGKFVTSEEMYYWMTAEQIPIECENWHLNRFITLVKICAIKNKPDDKKKKKLTSSDLARRRAQMEAARRKYGG